jgi:ABC-type transporter Mla maintaining outer membrane lipid asymmetry ATPase subunit MlaF
MEQKNIIKKEPVIQIRRLYKSFGENKVLRSIDLDFFARKM